MDGLLTNSNRSTLNVRSPSRNRRIVPRMATENRGENKERQKEYQKTQSR